MATLTLPELERHLWGAADLLRGSIDSGDFKHYIFGRLVLQGLERALGATGSSSTSALRKTTAPHSVTRTH